ncbi:transcriptional regulator, TetR family [Quadrisphaera granulorum]|uniref:TetR family transcriptional regulator n=2 Tax=Quadrisphaera granulorum TaxID=317664 RepID=A0A316AC00_9ACTN|nr:TetR family transcriptional regulator [Quadrisphaera granulorum]SZE95885.1 transcriptional regulator, TetR family [Quadrisphaera granulorum]
MTAAERRAQILDAARAVFGRRGYHGSTTDQVAKAAGISQPYVVRMFGTKEQLFIEVLHDTLTTLLGAFRAAHAQSVARGDDADRRAQAIGVAYLELSETRGFHTMLLQGFVSGAEPAIGAAARAGFLDIYRFLVHEAGFDDPQVSSFLGGGMLFSVLLGIEMPTLFDADTDAAALMQATFGDKCPFIVEAERARRASA